MRCILQAYVTVCLTYARLRALPAANDIPFGQSAATAEAEFVYCIQTVSSRRAGRSGTARLISAFPDGV